MAFFYNSQGKYKEAEDIYLQAINVYEDTLNENHPKKNLYIATPLQNLAILYDFIGQDEEAEYVFKKLLNIYKKIHGKDHPDYKAVLDYLNPKFPLIQLFIILFIIPYCLAKAYKYALNRKWICFFLIIFLMMILLYFLNLPMRKIRAYGNIVDFLFI